MAVKDKLVSLEVLNETVQTEVVDLISAKKYYLSTISDYGTLETGGLNSSNGAVNTGSSMSAWRMTPPIFVMKDSTVSVSGYGYRVRIGLFSDSSAKQAAYVVDHVNYNANATNTYTVPQDGYLRISFETNGTNIPSTLPTGITAYLIKNSAITGNPKVIFVATDGNNANDGSYSLPVATVNQALRLGATVVVMKEGTYAQRVDRSLANTDLLITKTSPFAKVTFVSPSSVVANAATNVSGKVYSATYSATVSNNQRWLFQDGIPDVTTLIGSERHPAQKRRTYRVNDTKIVRCTSTSVADATAEIEAYDGYKWFYDSANTTMYFSCPSPSTLDVNPICICLSDMPFFGTIPSYPQRVDISGIEIKYMYLNMVRTRDSVVSDCSVSNVFGEGCYTCGSANGLTFVRCEASQCAATETTGDGFNAHKVAGDTVADDVLYNSATLIDCWSHDNNDDGISYHDYGQMTVIGGLFEHNGNGGGVAPSTGCVCDCYNVYARNNGKGFINTNASPDSIPGTILAIGCVSEDNGIGFRVESEGNKGVFVDCKAINNTVGFSAGTDASMVCTDCGLLDCTTAKEGTVTVRTTAALE